MAINPATYVKNVGKSFGYAAIDSLSNRSSFLNDTKENLDSIKDIYTEIKDFAASPMEKIKNNQKLMSYSNDLKDGYKNLISDIKTGNLYNKSRSEEVFNKALGLDFDFDSMFDDIDLDADLADLDKEMTTSATISDSTDREIVAMDAVGSAIATAVSSATARSAEYIVGANAESTRLIMEQNKHIFNAMSTGLVGVNKTLGDIYKFTQPLTDHMKNSVTFYTKSTENQEKMITLLEQIAEQTKPLEVKKTSGRKDSRDISNFITSGGALNISGMKSMIKSNAKNAFDSTMIGTILGFADMMGDGSNIGLKAVTSNPIGIMMPFMFDALFNLETASGKSLGRSLDKLADNLTMFNKKLIKSLNAQKSNYAHPFLSFLGHLFDHDTGGTYKYKTDNYEKGAVPFDGITRKSIIEVIPNYLSMILTAITGMEQKYYDYDQGKFVSRSDIQKMVDKEVAMEASRASYDVLAKIKDTKKEKQNKKKKLNELEMLDDRKVESLISKYSKKAIISDDNVIELTDLGMDDDEIKRSYSKYGFSNEEELRLFLTIFRVRENRHYLERLNFNLEIGRVDRNGRENDYSVVANLHNNSGINPALNNIINRVAPSGRESETSRSGGSGGSSEEAASESEEGDFFTGWKQQLIDDGIPNAQAEKLVKEYRDALGDTESTKKVLEKVDKAKERYKKNAKTRDMVNSREVMSKFVKLVSAPLDFMSGQLEKASDKLYDIMYGKEGTEDKGLLGNIFENIDKLFTDFRDTMKQKFLDPIKKYFDERGGIKNVIADFFGISDETKDFWRDQKNKVKSKLASAGKWIWNNNPYAVYQRYKEQQGSGSGLYYGGASGQEPPKYEDGWQAFQKFYSKANGYEPGTASKEYQRAKSRATRKRNAPGFGADVMSTLSEGFTKFFNAITPGSKELNGETKKVGGVIKNALAELKIDPSGAIVGGIIGTGASLLTGGVVGPLVAASIGAAAGLTINSKSVQDALFGKIDEETGERDASGLLSKQLTDFLTKDLKKITGYGLTGAMTALIPFVPGGPVAGLIVGSAIGFANRNDALTNYLFGEKDKDNGLIKKETQEWVKKMLPKAGAGAVLGALAGPFGFVPNIMVGAALGFASETDRFQTILYGKEKVVGKDENGNDIIEREGGIAGWIKKDIIAPVANAISPIAVEIKNKSLDIIRWTIRSISNVFGKTVGIPLFKTLNEKLLTPLFNKLLPNSGKFIGNLISLPFRGIGGIGNALRRKQLRTGRANDLSARARLDKRIEFGIDNDEFIDFDTTLNNMTDEEIVKFTSEYNEIKNSRDIGKMNEFAESFRSKFGLQNVNIDYRNIAKYMDTVGAEIKNRGEYAKLNPEKVRNQLLQAHFNKIENMLGVIANHLLGEEYFDVKTPGGMGGAEESGSGSGGVIQGRRSVGTTIRSLFNPFTGMDMQSVTDALQFYEDRLAGNDYGSYTSRYNYGSQLQQLGNRVQKVEINGEFRDDIVDVTDKYGRTVRVQKINGSWMPYKWGSQMIESLKSSKIGAVVKTVGFTLKTSAKMIRSLIGSPFLGMDMDIVNRALKAWQRIHIWHVPVKEEDRAFMEAHITPHEVEYPGANVITVYDGRKERLVRFDEQSWSWREVTLAWTAAFRVKQTTKAIVSGVTNTARHIMRGVSNVIDHIRHINPFCDFDADEVPDIIKSLNLQEFDNAGDITGGRVSQVPGLRHYYKVVSKNGISVNVTARGGRWVYVSDKELEAAKARTLTFGLGGLIVNSARSVINRLFNGNIAGREPEEIQNNGGPAPAAAGSGLRYYRGGGFLSSVGNKVKGFIANKVTSGSSSGSSGSGIDELLNGNVAAQEDYVDKKRELYKINSEKFNPSEAIKNALDSTDITTKAGRDAFRKKQAELNIFRQNTFNTAQISKKLDVIIDGLVGPGGAYGRGGLLSNLAKIAAPALLLLAGKGLLDGKYDSQLEGMFNSVDMDNAAPGSNAVSVVTATDADGNVINIATEDGKAVSVEENGVTYYVDTAGNLHDASTTQIKNRGTRGYANKLPGIVAKSFLKGDGANPFTFARRGLGKVSSGMAAIGNTKVGRALRLNKLASGRFAKASNYLDDLIYRRGRNKVLGSVGNTKLGSKVVNSVSDSRLGKWLIENTLDESGEKLGTKQFLKNIFGKKATEELTEEGAEKATKIIGIEAIREATKKEGTSNILSFEAFKSAKAAKNTGAETVINKAIKEATEEVAEEGSEAVAKKQLKKYIKDAIVGFFTRLSNTKFGKILGGKCIKIGTQVGEDCAEEAAEKGIQKMGTRVAKDAATAVPVLGWVLGCGFALYEFEEGWNSAERTFKVMEPTILEKFVSGAAPAILELISSVLQVKVASFLVGIIPIDFIIRVCIDRMEENGFDFSTLSARRDDAEKYLAKINAEREEQGIGTTVTWDQLVVMTEAEGGLNERTASEHVIGGAKTLGYNYKQLYEYFVKPNTNRYKDKVTDSGYALKEEDFLTGFGSGLRGGSFVSQVDPAIAGRSFGNSTFGMNGCAPSVASMVTGMPVGSAANLAMASGYANRYGTSADYFGNIFSQAGIPSEYVYTGAGSAQDYLAGKIASGHPTVLLGQDPYNTSKAYSPFGPGNHYVLATGMTRNGGVVVQDPESRYPNQVYDSSILNSVKLGIPTGGRSGLRRIRNKIRSLRGGFFYNNGGQQSALSTSSSVSGTVSTTNLSTDHQQIWTYLKSKGISDEGAAALMGCWENESGNHPNRIEGDYMKAFPGFSTVTASNEALDSYTLNILFPSYKISINRNAYKGSDGHYYPGFGLAQWTGPRAENLLNFAKSKGLDWTSLGCQLDFAWNELNSKYNSTLTQIKQSGDLTELVRYVANHYEGTKREDWINKRTQSAVMIYNELSGKTFSMPSYDGTSGFSGSSEFDSSSSGTSSKPGIETFGSLFGDLVAAKFGKLGELFGLRSSSSEEAGVSGGEYGSSGSFGSYGGVYEGLANYDQSSPAGKAQADIVNTMYSVKDRLHYSQQTRNPEAGAADCSSTVNWAYNKVLGESIGSRTRNMFENDSNMVVVDSALGSLNKNGFNQNSPGPNIDNLQPGDILLYSRSGQAGVSPYGVGHVSMYIGNGRLLSHGGPGYNNLGPKEMNVMSAKPNTYLVAKRYRGFADGSYNEKNGYSSSTSGLSYGNSLVNERGVKLNPFGSGSGLYNIAQDGINAIHRKHKIARSVFGGGSGLVNMSSMSTTAKAKYMRDTIRSLRASGSEMNNDVMIALIKSIISLLTNVSANSEYMKVAAEKLGQVVGQMEGMSTQGSNLSVATNSMGINDMDSSISDIFKLLDSVATGDSAELFA